MCSNAASCRPAYVLQVYQPLELLLFIAAICTIADAFVPQLIAVPRVGEVHGDMPVVAVGIMGMACLCSFCRSVCYGAGACTS